MNTPDLPDPLVPPEVDIRDFPFMPIDIIRLFGSRFHAIATDSEWRAGVTLWLKSFHQVPAASLPNDDVELCRLAELGRDLKTWQKVKAVALHGWVLCSDGRLYHQVVAEKAHEAWKRKIALRERSRRGNAKRWGHGVRHGDEHAIHEGAHAVRQDHPGHDDAQQEQESPKDSQKESLKESNKDPQESPKDSQKESLKESNKDPKGQGQGQGQGQGHPPPVGRGEGGVGEGGLAPPSAPPPDARGSLSPEKRGTRLPADWELPEAWEAWALEEQPTWTRDHVRRVAACFRDYWHAKAGAEARKVDWEATWRNWVRKEGPLRQVQPYARPRPRLSDENAAAVEEARRLIFGG